MKVKVLSRNPSAYLRDTKNDIFKVPRNYDPKLHPLQSAREYTRALNAVKLERVFAKPFLCSLDGHSDGVHCFAKHPERLSIALSGSYDGEIRMWDLKRKQCVKHFQAHSGFVRGMAFEPRGDSFFSVGDDKVIKRWSTNAFKIEEPISCISVSDVLMDIAHSRKDDIFATCGSSVCVWEHSRATPVRTLDWGVDSVHKIRFNPAEPEIFASLASDRSIILYDCRAQDPLRKVIMALKSNSIAWNPMEPFVFTVANEDYKLYSFDMRRLSEPFKIHVDHVSAVMDVDYSPTGREFVSGSYDKTIRIFPQNAGSSREIYHTKRMQRVMVVSWTLDNAYILSGSDEFNIRLWKAAAWNKLGPVRLFAIAYLPCNPKRRQLQKTYRERNALLYAEKLKEKYAAFPEIRRIAKHRQLPKHVYNAKMELRAIRESQKRKEYNRIMHSKPGSILRVPERKKHIVREEQ
ncbi:WD domain, G-beta repeat protein [Trichuris suis]|uniref:DDB1- and CUL4-associated factor 13 n=1 Tax=Trichuris suis TaxID=68888 RepID=A0A085LKG4_9BILA|nr:hypothetical protein M513_13665 [Trichuris suis]KHJ43228.1 WD domain, G-beta repeat protein [Trichuris suis]